MKRELWRGNGIIIILIVFNSIVGSKGVLGPLNMESINGRLHAREAILMSREPFFNGGETSLHSRLVSLYGCESTMNVALKRVKPSSQIGDVGVHGLKHGHHLLKLIGSNTMKRWRILWSLSHRNIFTITIIIIATRITNPLTTN